MKYIQLLAILAVATLMSSCATILTGTTQRVTIDSTPPGAEILVDGQIMGTTPARVRLVRDINTFIDDGKEIRLEMDGYYADMYYLGTNLEPMVILNVFFWPGFALDAVTGAIMRYDRDYYNFRLQPLSGQNVQPGPVPGTDDNSGEDDYEKLMKLVDLYEQGMITEEEFEAEKAKIFNKDR